MPSSSGRLPPTPRGATLIQDASCLLHWPLGCIPACTGQEVYPSMHWTGGVCQHALGRGCMPACTGQGVCIPWAGGMSAQGDVCPGGCLPRGVCLGGLPRGVSAPGMSGQGGCLPRGCLPHTRPSCKQNHRYL